MDKWLFEKFKFCNGLNTLSLKYKYITNLFKLTNTVTY